MKNELITTLKDLIRINSISGNEKEISEYIENFFKKNNIPYTTQKVEEDRYNLIVTLGEGEKTIIFNGHIDTVNYNESQWRITPPLNPKEIDGKLYGLGSLDMKGAVSCMMMLAKKYSKQKLDKKVLFTFVVGEEVNGIGAEKLGPYLIKQGIDPLKSEAIICEPTDLKLSLGNKGNFFVDGKIIGIGGHSSNPNKCKNPIDALCELKNITNDITEKLVPYQDSLGKALAVITYVCANAKYSLDQNKIQVGSRNQIPPYAEFCLDIRPGENLWKDHFQILENIVENSFANLREQGYEIKLTYPIKLIGHRTPENMKIKEIITIYMNDKGKKLETIFANGANDSFAFQNEGINTINEFGPGKKCDPNGNALMHAPDEYVEISELMKGIEIYQKIIDDF